MSGFIDITALDNCYATMWSFGEICVNCNCCGRKSKVGMLAARFNYHKEELDNSINFIHWAVY